MCKIGTLRPSNLSASRATNPLSPIGRSQEFRATTPRRGAFVQKSQRPNSGPSAYFRNRQSLLAMTASAALLAGLASANALPLNQQGRLLPLDEAERLGRALA